MAHQDNKLFSPVKVGNLQLCHRIVMAPLTRFRADDEFVPVAAVKEYYAQRASTPGTLLITEATFISARASGLEHAPGIWSSKQIAAWKEVTDAVHAKGCFIFLQLWALGRRAAPSVLSSSRLEGGPYPVVAPSAMPVPASMAPAGTARDGEALPWTPRALERDEIQGFIADYASAAANAVTAAGFDGVELHGGNGYLIDQFLQETSNTRTDEYGGSVEKRSRFALDVTKAVIAAVGGDSNKVAVRLSPWTEVESNPAAGVREQDVLPQFLHVVDQLKHLDLAYLHLVESRIKAAGVDPIDQGYHTLSRRNDPFINLWGAQGPKPLILAGGFTPESAELAVERYAGTADVLVAFGRYYISTPDLPFRIREHIDLNPYNRSTFYTPLATRGYTDYPFSARYLAATATATTTATTAQSSA